MYAEYRSLGDGQKFMDREEQIMKRFSEKLVSRNYAKRFLALVLAAVILLAGTAELIPVALRKQISELKTMEDSFEKQAEQSGLADRIRFAGMVPHSGVSRYYRIGDVFVNASGSETQGLTFIEAMSAGIPVVCKADPCLEGVVINGKTGYACATAEEMAGTIGKIPADDALRGELTANAGALVREKYSSEAFAATMERVYRTTEIKPAYEKIAD